MVTHAVELKAGHAIVLKRLIDTRFYLHIFEGMQLDLETMRQAADQASALLKSMANRHRLLIMCRLLEGRPSVGEVAGFLGIRDSVVSQHLALLRKDGLVRAHRDGQTIRYEIASPAASRIVEALACIYCAPQKPADQPGTPFPNIRST